MSEPLIVGIRHHSPACARLVKLLIESQRPRYVLIEGPADFNDRVDELFLAHQLPVAIYSYCQYQDGAAPGRGAWTPFAEFSPEWQALQAARRIQAQTYFIDLPCWAQSEEEDESPDTQDESQTLLLRATRMDNSDTLGITYSKMKASKLHYPLHWRTILPNCGATPPAMHSIVSAKPLWLAGLHGRCSKTMATC